MTPRIALIGDFSDDVVAHRAIPRALELAAAAESQTVEWVWVAHHRAQKSRQGSRRLFRDLGRAGKPVRGYGRSARRPFAGPAKCSGLRWDRAAVSNTCWWSLRATAPVLARADHGETNPAGEDLVVAALSCSLVNKTGALRFATGSRLRTWYGRDAVNEGYNLQFRPECRVPRATRSRGAPLHRL